MSLLESLITHDVTDRSLAVAHGRYRILLDACQIYQDVTGTFFPDAALYTRENFFNWVAARVAGADVLQTEREALSKLLRIAELTFEEYATQIKTESQSYAQSLALLDRAGESTKFFKSVHNVELYLLQGLKTLVNIEKEISVVSAKDLDDVWDDSWLKIRGMVNAAKACLQSMERAGNAAEKRRQADESLRVARDGAASGRRAWIAAVVAIIISLVFPVWDRIDKARVVNPAPHPPSPSGIPKK